MAILTEIKRAQHRDRKIVPTGRPSLVPRIRVCFLPCCFVRTLQLRPVGLRHIWSTPGLIQLSGALHREPYLKYGGIRHLSDDAYTVGTHSVVWDGREVESGAYFLRFRAAGEEDQAKMLLLK
jgi:hypothetical protein